MIKKIIGLCSVLAGAASFIAVPASAQRHDRNNNNQSYEWRGEQDRSWNPAQSYRKGNYKDRRLGRNDSIYRGKDGRAYCRRSDGTTGLVVGGVGGAVLAKLVGANTLGTLAGGAGGALLGRQIDRGNVKCR